jgi:hypothetical protein
MSEYDLKTAMRQVRGWGSGGRGEEEEIMNSGRLEYLKGIGNGNQNNHI